MVITACPHCFANNQIDPNWTSVNCFNCGSNFVALAVRCDGLPPAGFERAATGACVRQPNLWHRSFGHQCPHCRHRGYVHDFGRIQSGQYLASRERQVTERHYGPYGTAPETGRTEHAVYVPTTVREYFRCFACLFCGNQYQRTESEEL